MEVRATEGRISLTSSHQPSVMVSFSLDWGVGSEQKHWLIRILGPTEGYLDPKAQHRDKGHIKPMEESGFN
jgi:hypothetical protein